MTKYQHHRHDYMPAVQHDALLPTYDLLSHILRLGGVHRTLIEQTEIADGHRVLEIGSGTGTLSLRAKRSCPAADVIGVDPDPLALVRARRKVGDTTGIRFDHGYAQKLGYADGEFDRVLSSLMLHHLDNEAKAAAMSEAFRVLRPGGRLHLVDIEPDGTERHGPIGRFLARRRHASVHVHESIPTLFQAAGFDVAEVGARQHPVIGRLAFYRATRPA